MSNSPPSQQPPQPELPHESDVVSEASLSLDHETPDQPDPPSKSDPESIPTPHPVTDPVENIPEEEEEDDDDVEGEEIDEGHEHETPAASSGTMSLRVDPPITDSHVSPPDVTLTSPSNSRRANKRKKGKGKGKPNIKKLQAIEEKLRTLSKNLNPIPFIPQKLLDFAKHEKLLKKLGLWDFFHIDFDRNIRVDLIAQLVATYESKLRASYVKNVRIMVNRADLARAFKLPFKKEKGNVGGGVEVESEWEVLTDDSIGFIVEFVLDWVLLHEDMWMMPNEVTEWLKVIRDGHPEKVDWAGLFWFMVEKELKQGGQLRDCYYASHLQHLIKHQRGEEFLMEESIVEAVEFDAEAKEEDGVNDGNVGVVGPSTELTLGKDGEKEEEMKDVEMMDVDKSRDSDEEGGEEEEEDEQEQWLLHGKNDLEQHFLQRCSAENDGEFGTSEKDEEEEGNEFHGFANDDDAIEGDGFTGNLLQAMEAHNQMGFTSQDQLHNPSSIDIGDDMQHIASSAQSLFNNAGKRVIEHDNHIPHRSVNDSNKRLRLDDSWDHNKTVDFGTCMEQIQQMAQRARMFYEEKEQNLVQSNVNQQVLLNELQKRDAVIEHLQKTRLEEMQKKNGEIYRLERELYLMGNVLEGYRKALKDVQKAFAEYKEKAQLREEPTYKDTGCGGLMLTNGEMEKLRKKQEEEYKMNCLIVEQKVKKLGEEFGELFEGFVDKVKLMDERLIGLEANAKALFGLYAKRKFPQAEEKLPELVAEPLPIVPREEEVPEAAEDVPIPQTEEEVPEIAEPLPNE